MVCLFHQTLQRLQVKGMDCSEQVLEVVLWLGGSPLLHRNIRPSINQTGVGRSSRGNGSNGRSGHSGHGRRSRHSGHSRRSGHSGHSRRSGHSRHGGRSGHSRHGGRNRHSRHGGRIGKAGEPWIGWRRIGGLRHSIHEKHRQTLTWT